MSVVEWDNELVVYHHRSGDTYLFVDLAKQIVSFCLLRESFSVSEVLKNCLGQFDNQQHAEKFTQSVIEQMVRTSLIAEDAL